MWRSPGAPVGAVGRPREAAGRGERGRLSRRSSGEGADYGDRVTRGAEFVASARGTDWADGERVVMLSTNSRPSYNPGG